MSPRMSLQLSLFVAAGCFLGYWSLFFGASRALAVVDPLTVPNNKIGIHILDTSEALEASKLVNSSGGDWGYVTIPIRSDDRDHNKWNSFFQDARKFHLIPIVRLATYVDADTWVAPTPYDLVDFANFLADMPWPVKNRYVILFNEPNHATEWGGSVAPDRYARLLMDARDIFTSRSSDFFLLSAGLDMSAPTNSTSLDALEFYRRMSLSVPDWYSAVDGLAVHAYPNPGFTAPVYSGTRYGIKSFEYEQQYLSYLGFRGKPIFITETGTLSSGNFFHPALTTVWTDKNIVAITPFLLFAGAGSFYNFSLLDINRHPTPNYQDLFSLPKIAGSPLLSPFSQFPIASAPASPNPGLEFSPPSFLEKLGRLFSLRQPYLNLGDAVVSVEISDTDASRTHGLSDRPAMPADHGMLFVFPTKMPQTFWMKDMHFPLDFVWIADGKIVELNSDVPPPAQTGGVPIVINPANFVDRVLEVNAGFIQTHHLRVGDTVSLSWR